MEYDFKRFQVDSSVAQSLWEDVIGENRLYPTSTPNSEHKINPEREHSVHRAEELSE